MPHSSSTTASRTTNRITTWRVLLALLLGLGTWWALEWWLYPRSLYTLKYPHSSEGFLNVAPLDQEGRLLLVVTSSSCDYEVVELSTGKIVAKGPPSNGACGPQWRRIPGGELSLCQLVNYSKANTHNGVLYTDGSYGELRCLWELNLKTGQSRALHPCPRHSYAYASSDASTLVQVTDLDFNNFVPPSACPSLGDTLLYALQHCQSVKASISLCSFWSLPDHEFQCTIAIDGSLYNTGHLTGDGRWLVFCDGELPDGITSLRRLTEPKALNFPPVLSSLHLKKAAMLRYVRLPEGIRVFDTRTGLLHFATDTDGCLLLSGHGGHPCQSIMPLLQVPDEQVGEPSPNKVNITEDQRASKHCYLHLPTRKWLPVNSSSEGFQEVAGPASRSSVRWITAEQDAEDSHEIKKAIVWETYADGTTLRIGELSVGWDEQTILIADSSQAAQVVKESMVLPNWVNKVLSHVSFIESWMDRKRHRVFVRDYEKGVTLWSQNFPADSESKLSVSPTGSFLIVSTHHEWGHEVTVLSLPLPSWSSWWGFLSCVLTCSAFVFVGWKRRRVR